MSQAPPEIPEVLVKGTLQEQQNLLYNQASMIQIDARTTTDPTMIAFFENTVDILIENYLLTHERKAAPTLRDGMGKVSPALHEQYDPEIRKQQQSTAQSHMVNERDQMIRLKAIEIRFHYVRDIFEKRGQLASVNAETEKEL